MGWVFIHFPYVITVKIPPLRQENVLHNSRQVKHTKMETQSSWIQNNLLGCMNGNLVGIWLNEWRGRFQRLQILILQCLTSHTNRHTHTHMPAAYHHTGASLLFWEFSLHRWQEKAFWLMWQSENDLCMRRELSILHSIFNHLIKYRTSPMTAIHHFHLKAFRKAPSHMQGLYAPLRLQLINWLRFVNGVSYKVLSVATLFWSF